MTYFSLAEDLDLPTIKALERQLVKNHQFQCSQCQRKFVRVYPRSYKVFRCYTCKA